MNYSDRIHKVQRAIDAATLELANIAADLQREYGTHYIRPSVRQIQDTVCEHFGVSLNAICSPRRPKELVRARTIAFYLTSELTGLGLSEIGRCFGNCHHTTVLEGIRRAQRWEKLDRELSNLLAVLRQKAVQRLEAIEMPLFRKAQ